MLRRRDIRPPASIAGGFILYLTKPNHLMKAEGGMMNKKRWSFIPPSSFRLHHFA
jgi:hypothetical protein